MNTQNLLTLFGALTDDVGQPPLWSLVQRLFLLNEAQLEAVRRARLLVDGDTEEVCRIAVTAGTQVYDVDPRVIFIREVRFIDESGKECRLRKVHPKDLERFAPGWRNAEATAEPIWWTPYGSHQICIEKTTQAGTLHLDVVREPLKPCRTAETLDVDSITLSDDVATVTLTEEPEVAIETGDTVTISGADQSEYNITASITVLSPKVFTYAVEGSPATPATGTITASIHAVDPEIPDRYRPKLVDWMLHRALLQRDKEEKYDPKSAADHLVLFEGEFGQRSSAIDETWIQRNHGYDEHEGLY